MLYAIYDHGVYIRDQDFDKKPVLPGKPYRKFYVLTEEPRPEYDPFTQDLTGPFVEEDHAGETRRVYWVIIERLVEDIKDDDDAKREQLVHKIDPALLRLSFHAYNNLNALEQIVYALWAKEQPLKTTIEDYRKVVRKMLGTLTAVQFMELVKSYMP
jgi:hypothetical protein